MSMYNFEKNRVVWVDIPVADLDRACRFYEQVLAIKIGRDSYEGFEFAVLEHEDGNGGCLVPDPEKISDGHGPLVYLNVDARLQEAVARVEPLGGKITQGVHAIGPHGFRALIVDSEGNRMALHSPSDG